MTAGVRRERPGQGAATRGLIADTAQAMFTENGYAGTSVRAIAGVVGVDPALVIRYFGSKERLFLETMKLPGFIERALPGPAETMGERIVAAMFTGDVGARLSVFSALMRACDTDAVRAQIREAGDRTVIEPLVGFLRGPGAELRARLIAAQITGLLTTLALGEDLGGPDRADLIRVYGCAVQALIDSPE